MKGPPAIPVRFATLGAMLASAAAGPGGLTFVDLRERETALGWEELDQRARDLAARLVALGLAPGERVALVLPTGPGFVAAFFAIGLAGAVPVPLYPPARLGALGEYNAATARLLDAVGAALVLSEMRIAAVLGEALARARPRLGLRTLASLPPPAPGPLPARGPGDLALIQFSSGSTRAPKPVALTHAALLAQCAMLEAMLPPRAPGEEARGASWLPLYHDMGLIAGPLLAAHVPGRLVLIPPELFLARPALWPRALSRHRAALTPAPPFALGLCARRVGEAELRGVDLSAVRLLTVGAEPIVPATVEAFVARFAPAGLDPGAIRPVYGLSEAALAVTFAPARRALRVTGVDPVRLAEHGEVAPGARPVVSVGAPLPGVEIELRDAAGAPLGEGRVGRVHVRGPSLMSGYFGRPRESAEALAGGWLDTGDLGFVLDGELHVSGRVKDVVVVRGANHDAAEFEAPLAGLAGLRPGCAAAVGFLPPGAEGEEVLLLAERDPQAPRRDDATLERSVRDAVLRATGIAPHTIALLAPGALPRTSSGKLRRAEALRRFQAGTLVPPPAADPVRLAGALARSAAGHLRSRGPRG